MNEPREQVEQFERDNPLWRYSPYLWGRVNVLLGIRIEILELLDRAFGAAVELESLSRAEELAWLWVLGAYEVVRTMSQSKASFSPRLQTELLALKRQLGIVRMPTAKMELPGKRIPVTSSRSPVGIDAENRDILLGAPDHEISGRKLLASFYAVMSTIAPQDVHHTHEESYGNAS